MKKHIRTLGAAFALTCALTAGGAQAADDDRGISRQLASDLYKEVAVGTYGLRVRTLNGIVRLSGSVGTIRDWRIAQRMAEDAAGGADVQNDLNVVIR
jgi:osmotically-inducible protein OsmY